MGILLGGDKNVTQVDCSDDCVTLNVNFKWVNFKICGLYLNKAIFFKSICVEKNFYQGKKIAGLHLPTQLRPPKKKKKVVFLDLACKGMNGMWKASVAMLTGVTCK